MGLGNRISHAWNSFISAENNEQPPVPYVPGFTTSVRPDRPRLRINSERTIIASVYNRLAIDIAGVRIEHVRVDDKGQYVETIKSGLNDGFNVEANLDQAGRHFRQDIALSLLSNGVVAIIPVETDLNPFTTGGWDVKQLRVGLIKQWFPTAVKVEAYDQRDGQYHEIILPKSMVAIVENPLYSVMNEPNSTLQRLIHKLSLLDNVDEISSQGKLDIIIQLPYVVKSDTRKKQAAERAKQIQDQLQGSTYGIAYTDGTEKITQLNRSIENNLLEQVKYLREELYSELGLTPEIMNGTANDVVMMNYYHRTIEPIMDAITEAIARTFLTKTARTQGQTIMYFQNPFKLVPISQLGKLIDVLSRNQVIAPNEIRPAIGLRPSQEPQANQLINSNMPLDKQVTGNPGPTPSGEPTAQTDPADDAEAQLDQAMAELGIS